MFNSDYFVPCFWMAAPYLILIYVTLGGDRAGCIIWTGDSSGVSGNHAVHCTVG